MARIAIAVGSSLLLPIVAIAAAISVLTGYAATTSAPAGGAPAGAITDIPAAFLALYEQAGARFGVPWWLLAGIGKVECDHGRGASPACASEGAENSAGAGGPMQFLAATWATYGVDADQDGRVDRWTPADAIFGAASGAPGDLRGAIFAYNHSQDYVDEVLSWAEGYRQQLTVATPATDAPSGDRAQLGAQVLADPRIELRPEAVQDIRAGRVDPRLLAALLTLAQRFRLGAVGPFISGHTTYVAGTNRVSNHIVGRAGDIPLVNGQAVSPGNPAARELAIAASQLPASIRPTEIGSPWALSIPGAFTDADHQNHVHLGYDQ
jgi:hypothetical protein